MQQSLVPALWTAVMVLSLAWAQDALAHSHEGPGEHVQTFEEHLDDYAADVDKLSATLDGVAGQYIAEKDAQAAIDAFIEQWEEVEFHEAVETVAIPLYPPIWEAISGLQQALKKEVSIKQFVQSVRAVQAALHEGMGGVRLAAAQRVQGLAATQNIPGDEQPAESLDAQAEIEAIKAALDAAVEAYSQGQAEEAKALVQDAYLHRFEGLEGDLIARDPELVSALEREFNVDLPGSMDSGEPEKDVAALVQKMHSRLDRAAELLAKADNHKSKVF